MRRIISSRALISHSPANYTTESSTIAGKSIDRRGANGALGNAMFCFVAGTITAGGVQIRLYDSDDETSWDVVPDALLDYRFDAASHEWDSGDDNKIADYRYLGTRRYVQARAVMSGFSGQFGAVCILSDKPGDHFGKTEVQIGISVKAGGLGGNASPPVGGEQYDACSVLVVLGAQSGAGAVPVTTWIGGHVSSTLTPVTSDRVNGALVPDVIQPRTGDNEIIRRADCSRYNMTYQLIAYGAGGVTTPGMVLFLHELMHGQNDNATRNIL